MNLYTPPLVAVRGGYDTARVAWHREAARRALNALAASQHDRRYRSERMTEVRHRERVARKYGAEFVYAGSIAGREFRGWVQCANQGEPFNGAVGRVVMLEVLP